MALRTPELCGSLGWRQTLTLARAFPLPLDVYYYTVPCRFCIYRAFCRRFGSAGQRCCGRYVSLVDGSTFLDGRIEWRSIADGISTSSGL